MKWKVNVDKGAGPITFGMDEGELKDIFLAAPQQFKRLPEDDQTIYAYDDIGCHVGVSSRGQVVSLVVFQPNELVLYDVQLLGRPLKEVVDDLAHKNVFLSLVDAGAWVQLGKMSVTFVDIEDVVDGVELTRS